MKRKSRYFMGDFETTVYDGQKDTRVWASGMVEFGSEEAYICSSIEKTFAYWRSLRDNIIVYYHNLKFDGEFIIYYLLHDLKYEQALTETYDEDGNVTYKWLEMKYMKNKSFRYSISSKGQWYTITIKANYGQIIEIRDSLKLLPFSVKKLGKDFNTKHKKLDMTYKGFRQPNGEIKPEEKKYLVNDLLVPKEALEIMFEQGHTALTIGSCCLKEFKTIINSKTAYDYDELFPDLYKIPCENQEYKSEGKWIHKTYKGAVCLLVKGKENKVYYNGVTFDVNSLYPYVMHSASGNRYPVGKGNYWCGNYIPEEATAQNRYYFVHIKTRFYLKPGKLPYIQIKGTKLYKGTEHLSTSDVYDYKTDKYYRCYKDKEGNIKEAIADLFLTMTDLEIIKEQYRLEDFEIIDGYWFYTEIGIFDEYIDKYKQIKMNSTGAIRGIAKLFSNNLYGKEAASDDSSFKICYIKETGEMGFKIQQENDKKPGYIPIGSAITSYARAYTFKKAQMNYYGPDKPGFIYCDTDSLHLDLPLGQIKGIEEHETEYGLWKAESEWDYAIFVRQKTYIEHVVKENHKPVNPWYNVKCAGMPSQCKDLFVKSMTEYHEWKDMTELDEDKKRFLFDYEKKEWKRRDITDFKIGLEIPGKLFPKHIPGGVLLTEGYYTMH